MSRIGHSGSRRQTQQEEGTTRAILFYHLQYLVFVLVLYLTIDSALSTLKRRLNRGSIHAGGGIVIHLHTYYLNRPPPLSPFTNHHK